MAVLLPIIASIGSLAGAGVGIGTSIANSVSGSPAAPTVPGPTPPNQQQLLAQKEAVSQQLPNVIGQTSGLASPSYDSLISQILSGVIGQPGANAAGAGATGQAFSTSNSQPTNAAVQGQPIQLSDFVNSNT